MNTTKISINTTVLGSVQKAWEYYTNPIHIVKWNFASPDWQCPTASNNMQVGGRYTARMEAKDGSVGFDFEATYKEIVPHERFTFTLDDGREVIVVFTPNGEETEVNVVFDAESENPIEMQKAGWQAILDNFEDYIENH